MKPNQVHPMLFVLSIACLLSILDSNFRNLEYQYSLYSQLLHAVVIPFQLDWFQVDMHNLTGFEELDHFMVLDFCMAVLGLLASVFFMLSQGKENRLALFVWLVIFLSQLSILIMGFPAFFFYMFGFEKGQFVPFLLLTFTKPALYVFVSYKALKAINPKAVPLSETTQYGEIEVVNFQTSSLGIRFFHYLIDIFLLIAIYSAYVFSWPKGILQNLANLTGNSFAIGFYFMMVGFFYYAVSEALFGATPGKMLTHTRVFTLQGKPSDTALAIKRTLMRYIPLEPFTFFSNAGGLHDRLADSQVVDIAHEGKSGGRYFWLIALLFVLLILFIAALLLHESDVNIIYE